MQAGFIASRVLILTVDDRRLPEDVANLSLDTAQWPYYLLSHISNSRYAQRHGYSYRRIVPAVQSTRASSWHKLSYLLHELDADAYELVVAVDSDAWYSNQSLSLHEALSCFAPAFLQGSAAAELLFSRDFALSPEREGEVNAGVFITKTTHRARSFWRLWWDAADTAAYSRYQSEWPFEQEVVNRLLASDPALSPLFSILPRGIIYGHAAAYINHVTSYWPRQRGWKGRRERLLVHDLVVAAALAT